MSRDRFLKPAGWVTIAMAMLSPGGASAYEFRLVPSLAAREGYNSNIYFTPQDPVESWVTKVTPGLDVSGKTERLDAAAGGNLTWWWYNADSNLNTIDYDVRGRAAYRFTDHVPRLGDRRSTGRSRARTGSSRPRAWCRTSRWITGRTTPRRRRSP